MPHSNPTPRQSLRQAVHSTYTVGVAFLLVGLFPAAVLAASPQLRFLEQLFVFTSTVMLIAPGVWYIAAAYFMYKLELWPIRISFRVAAAQSIIVVAGLFAQFLGRSRVLFVPASLALVFLPALGALIFELRRACAAIQVLQPTSRAFQPVNVVPLDSPQSPIMKPSTTALNPENQPD